jgi:aryl-alcohol dehydrogenase-like predicted oxidoreductase
MCSVVGTYSNHTRIKELHLMLNSRLDNVIIAAKLSSDKAVEASYKEGLNAGRIERALNESTRRLKEKIT